MALVIHTSRSDMVAMRNCPRLRLLSSHSHGGGLEPIVKSIPLLMGQAVHTAIAAIWEGKSPEEALLAGKGELEGIPPARMDEQLALYEGLFWAWIRVRYPLLIAEFEPVAIEKELVWKMGEKQGVTVYDHIRCDAFLRRRADGGLFYWEIKTSADPGDEWVKSWEHNSQLLINTLAIEELLGERVQGVIIEGLAKGRYATEKMRTSPWYGQKIQQSPLCYLYVSPTGELSPSWQKNWRKGQAWKILPAKKIVYDILSPAECEALFVPVPPIRPDSEALQRHREQCLWQESDVALGLEACKEDPSNVDRYFPLNDDHCYRYWGHPCQFETLCFNRSVSENPLGAGFRPRTHHHRLFPVPPVA